MDQQQKGYPSNPPQYHSPAPGNQQYYQQPQYQQQQYGQQQYPPQGGNYYQPQPMPQTVYVQQQPQQKDNSMCMGCLAAMCFCCALDAIF